MILRFIPKNSDLTSMEAFKDAVRKEFKTPVYVDNTEEWHLAFDEYNNLCLPNNIVEVEAVKGQFFVDDLKFNVVDYILAIKPMP